MGCTSPLSLNESEALAATMLSESRFAMHDCYRVLTSAPLKGHTQARQASAEHVAQSSGNHCFGLYAHGNFHGVTNKSSQHKSLVSYLNAWLLAHEFEPPWTSLNVNDNVLSPLHKDSHNCMCSVNQIIGLGSYSGGDLWLELPSSESVARHVVHHTDTEGGVHSGRLIPIKHRRVTFSPKLRHATMPWQGSRWTVVAYVSRSLASITAAELGELRKLGFPLHNLKPALWAQGGDFPEKMGPGPLWPAKGLRDLGPLILPTNLETQGAGQSLVVPQRDPEAEAILPASTPSLTDVGAVVAVVIEEVPAVAAVLQAAHYLVEHHHHSGVNSVSTATLGHRIKQGQVRLLWCDLPQRGRHVKPDRLSSHLGQLNQWFRICCECRVPCFLFGAFGGQWLHQSIDDLVRGQVLVKTYHRLCNLGMKVDVSQSQPSRACFVVAANRSIPHSPCKCSLAQSQHRLDWISSALPQQRRRRAAVHADMARHVIQLWLHVDGDRQAK